MTARFEKRSVLVTGASRGLGRAIATAFASEGARVHVGYRANEKEAAATLEDVTKAGGTGSLVRMDVRDRSSVDAAIDEVLSHGDLDILVNNAGLARDQLAAMMSPKEWDDVIATNLGGAFHCSRAVIRHMLSRRQGVIINMSSVAGLHASPGQANYSASKGGIIAMTRTLAAELAPKGIRVNAVVPGLFTTGMAQRLDHRILEEKKRAVPVCRLGEARELASVVLFLASDEASYIIGQAIVVDGGLTL